MGIPVNLNSEERFDALSLARCIKNIGRAYQRQAIELINLCRIFMEKSPPERRHEAMPKLTMLAITEALRSATVAGKRQTDKASAAFQEAKVKLLRYRATVHPGLRDMDAMITQKMTRAKERDERSLELFNQIRERRGPTDTSRLPNDSGRIRVGHTAERVDTEAQVACSPTADAPSERSYAPSASTSTSTSIPPPTRVRVKEGQRSPPDNGHTPCSPHTPTHRASLASMSPKRPTAGSCSTAATTTPVPPAPGASGSPETRSHLSSITSVTFSIQQSSFEPAGPRGNQPTTVSERPESVSLPPSSMPPHIPVPPLPHSSPPSTRTDPPPSSIDLAPKAGLEHRNGTNTQRSSNTSPHSGTKKIPSPIRSQIIIKSITHKPSIKFASFSIPPSSPTREAPHHHHHHLSSLEEQLGTIKIAPPIRLTMPGAFPGTSLDVDIPLDVDISSWVMVGPVSPVEESKPSWFKRLFSRRG